MRRLSASEMSDGGFDKNNSFYCNGDSENNADSFCQDKSIVDLESILEQRAGHDFEFLTELLSDLRREIHAQVCKIKNTLPLLHQDDADCEAYGRVERAAQSIKDASFDMFCSNLHEIAESLEFYAKEKNLKGCVQEYQNLEFACNLLYEILDSIEGAGNMNWCWHHILFRPNS